MSIVAVVVTFEPDMLSLNQQIGSLLQQVNNVLVVDNCSSFDVDGSIIHHDIERMHFKKLDDNFGIAYVQNLGIQFALELNANYVLLMDQDSLPEADMVLKLKVALLDNVNNEFPAVAAGPMYIDRRTGVKSFFVLEKHGLPNRWHPKNNSSEPLFMDVSFLISSGTLIDLNIFPEIRGMRSNYFIDHVDTEWSFRARAEGFRLLGVPHAKMNHALGDKVSQIWFFGVRQVSHHSPLRDYYMFRNTILMIRDVKMSAIWKQYFIWRLLQFAVFFLVFTPNRLSRMRSMFLGLKHGVFGVSGKVDLKTASCLNVTKSHLEP